MSGVYISLLFINNIIHTYTSSFIYFADWVEQSQRTFIILYITLHNVI